ncbi:MAG: hypothetical protein ACJA1A_001375 [Saprospiraceae bacterium]|jgi:hypothetical protein
MKSLFYLKLMINLFFYGQVLLMLFSTAFTLYNGSFNIGGEGFDNLNVTIILYMISILVGVASFLIAIYHIKELANTFSQNQLFNDKTSRHMKMIGYGFIIYSIVSFFKEPLSDTLHSTSHTWISGNFLGFSSGWFQFTLGLLFIFLNNVLNDAKELKRENDLTI